MSIFALNVTTMHRGRLLRAIPPLWGLETRAVTAAGILLHNPASLQADRPRWSAAAWAAACIAGAVAVSSPWHARAAACEAPPSDGGDEGKVCRSTSHNWLSQHPAQAAPSEREKAIFLRLSKRFEELDMLDRRSRSRGRPSPVSPPPPPPHVATMPHSFSFGFDIRRNADLIATVIDAVRAVHACHADTSLPLSLRIERDMPSQVTIRISSSKTPPPLEVRIQLSTDRSTILFIGAREPTDEVVNAIMSAMTTANTDAPSYFARWVGMLPPERFIDKGVDINVPDMDAFFNQVTKEMQNVLQELFKSPSPGSQPRQSDPSDDSRWSRNDVLRSPPPATSQWASTNASQGPELLLPSNQAAGAQQGPWAYDSAQGKALLASIQRLGGHVYLPTKEAAPEGAPKAVKFDWDVLAGYQTQKQNIEDTVLLALQRPEVYAEVAKGTRGEQGGSLRPRGVLFEGPPGCGKTTSARWGRRGVHVHLGYACTTLRVCI